MDFWHFYIPVAAAGILSVLYELRRPDCGTAEQHGLLRAYLAAIFFPPGGIAAGIVAVNYCYSTLHLRGFILRPAMLLSILAVVLITFFAKAIVTKRLHICRKHRIISSAVMLLAYFAELTAFGFQLAASV